MKKVLLSTIGIVAVLQLAPAADIVGGSNILTSAYADQLQAWLGEGPITITNIFSHTPGDGKSPDDFHAAADGKGRTFSVMQALVFTGGYGFDAGYSIKENQIVGGYDARSWDSTSGFDQSVVGNPFIFNLSNTVKQSQVNRYQTFNAGVYGPTFGEGFDLTSTYHGSPFDVGLSWGQSYGPSITGPNVAGDQFVLFNVGNLEVFTISNGVKPNTPAPAAILVFGLGALARRRRNR